jgi:hypothetical protein
VGLQYGDALGFRPLKLHLAEVYPRMWVQLSSLLGVTAGHDPRHDLADHVLAHEKWEVVLLSAIADEEESVRSTE